MRGKCATCEFYVPSSGWVQMKETQPELNDESSNGACHIQSVEKWPPRDGDEGCREYQSNAASLKRQSCEGPEIHEADRVEKSMERIEEPS